MSDQRPPPITVVGPDGDPVTISDLGRSSTVRDLAVAFGCDRVSISGTATDPSTPLVDVPEFVVGCRVERYGSAETPDAPVEPTVGLAVVAGPDVAPARRIGVGRHVIGRSPRADIVIDDCQIEPFHALLEVRRDRLLALTQLAGAIAVRVDGDVIPGRVDLPAGVSVELGASQLIVGGESARGAAEPPVSAIDLHRTDPWRRVVRRAPVVDPPWVAPSVDAPKETVAPSGPPATPLVGAAMAALGAVVVAVVMKNPMFAMFAGVGALGSLVTWGASVVGTCRARRRAGIERVDDITRFEAELETARRTRRRHHERWWPMLGAVLERELADVWSCRAESRGLAVTVGLGSVRWSPSVASRTNGPDCRCPESMQLTERMSVLSRVGVPLTLAPGGAVALHGGRSAASAVARAVVVQLALRFGPADWRLVVVSRRRPAWSWADWLPHGAVDGCALVDAGDEEGLAERLGALGRGSRLVVVTDEPHLLTVRTGPLRRFLDRTDAVTIAVVDTESGVPAICHRVLRIGSAGRASWVGDVPPDDRGHDIVPAGLSITRAGEVACRLACLVDPEDETAGGGGMPTRVTLSELFDGDQSLGVDAVIDRWSSGGSDPRPVCRLGTTGDETVEIDLVRDGPHALIAGTTGSGKSELLRSLVLGLAASVSPRHLNVVLVDYKGGSTFDACSSLPHTVGVVTDLDDGLAERALTSLSAELRRRERLLRDVGAADLVDYRRRPDLTPIARLVVVVDEFAALAVELPDFLTALIGVAQRGRSLGIHLVLATQRPAGVVSDDIRANTNLRIALRVNDRADALDVVADACAVDLPRGVPGRAVMRIGADEPLTFQSAWCSGPARTVGERRPTLVLAEVSTGRPTPAPCETESESELERAVAAIRSAASVMALPAAIGPWVEPLPHPLGDLAPVSAREAPGVIGLIDDPAGQCHRPLRWEPALGNLLLVGAVGSGTTSTMISIAAATCRGRAPAELHVYVLDGAGDDGLRALAGLAHCGGVIAASDRECVDRLLARLDASIEARRRAVDADAPPVVLFIDGWSSVRRSLDGVERAAQFEVLRRIVEDGPALGVVTVASDHGRSSGATALPVRDRWVFALDDPTDARAFGVATPPVARGRPGRLRIASSGLEAQVAQGAAGLAEIVTHDVDGSGPRPIRRLPRVVRPECARGERWRSTRSDDAVRLVVGLGGADVAPDHLLAREGEPILIVGAANSGVSSALECVVSALRDVEGPVPAVMRVDRTRAPDRDAIVAPRRAGLIVAVDDAHRVEDPDGLLSSIANGEVDGATLVAAGRADVIRTAYGHWTREAARTRCGIVMSAGDDTDGEVFGITLPRRPPIEARAGLGWLVDDRPLRQVQLVHVAG